MTTETTSKQETAQQTADAAIAARSMWQAADAAWRAADTARWHANSNEAVRVAAAKAEALRVVAVDALTEAKRLAKLADDAARAARA